MLPPLNQEAEWNGFRLTFVSIQTISRSHFTTISIHRQNIWDFDRIAKGPLAGAYVHSKFVRGNPSLCFEMVRQRHVPCFIPDWQGDEMSDQQELGTKRQGARTLDSESQGGQQMGNKQVKHARPMTLNECLAFFCEKERENRESQMMFATNHVNCPMIPPIISFDNLFAEKSFMIDSHRQLAHIHPPSTSRNHSVNPYCIEDTDIGLPFNPTSLTEPVLHDLETIFS